MLIKYDKNFVTTCYEGFFFATTLRERKKTVHEDLWDLRALLTLELKKHVKVWGWFFCLFFALFPNLSAALAPIPDASFSPSSCFL